MALGVPRQEAEKMNNDDHDNGDDDGDDVDGGGDDDAQAGGGGDDRSEEQGEERHRDGGRAHQVALRLPNSPKVTNKMTSLLTMDHLC